MAIKDDQEGLTLGKMEEWTSVDPVQGQIHQEVADSNEVARHIQVHHVHEARAQLQAQ